MFGYVSSEMSHHEMFSLPGSFLLPSIFTKVRKVH